MAFKSHGYSNPKWISVPGSHCLSGILSISFFLLLIISSPNGTAQDARKGSIEYQYRAVHWGIAEKMVPSPAFGMIKDVNGFLWIGTRGDGLIRFDGSQFKYYRHQKDNNSISGDDIGGLIEDSLHNIWIGTVNGLSLLDIRADTFRTIAVLSAKLPSEFASEYAFTPFWATKDEVFCWDYPGSQWAAFNIHTLRKRSLAKMLPNDIGKDLADRYSIFDAGSNSVWIENGPGGSPGGGLLQVSLSTGKKLPYTWNCFRNIPNDDHSFQGMCYDRRRHAIWISCTDGLVEFTLADKQFHHFKAVDSLVQLKDYHLWAGIAIDTLGHIWMGTYPKGIIIYDPVSQSLRLPFPNDSVLQQNISAENVMIYCGRDGMVWSGSWGNTNGIYQLIPFSPPVNHYISEPGKSNSLSNDFTVNCRYAGQGKVLIGTADGLNIFDTESGLFQVLRKKDLPGLTGEIQEIQPISIDTLTQKAWILAGSSYQTGMRYYQLDMRSKRCIPIIFKDSNDQNVGNRMGSDIPFENGSIIGINYPGRSLLFIGNSDSIVAKQILSFPNNIIEIYQTASDYNHSLFLKQGSLPNLSYTLVHGKWTRANTPLDTINWITIKFNKADQSYWLNVDNHLLHFGRDFKMIQKYSQKDGLPEGNWGRLIPDNYGNIWFTNDHSIYRLDIKSGRISMLSERDGFQANGFYIGLGPIKSAAGDIYIPSGASGKGFTRISPEKYLNSVSAVYIRSLLVNQQPYRFSPGIKKEPEIFLRYFENRFTVDPGIIDFISVGKNQFRYKLGKSADWIYPYNNIIYYDNLAPDNYDLIMQASNSNVFSGPATTLHIHISPPWWQTWWARSLFALAFIFLLWGFIQWRSRNLRQKNIQLEEKVSDRTRELNQSLQELRSTQTQLIQREKMASLGELTAGIAHEIQNPLNFVNNFSDVNTELIEELKEEQKKESRDLQNENKIMNDIEQNELKINYHGKRADAIVKSMLQHSRASTSQKELSDINALADEYFRLSYHGMRAKEKSFNATMHTDFDQSIEKININPQDIGRVLLNLFNNSFYSVNEKKKKLENGLPADLPAGAIAKAGVLAKPGYEPMVSVSTKKLDHKVVLRVSDNGIGISQKILDKIYQPFFTTKPTGEGTGLGLSLSYDIITKMHGGELRVDTKEGEFAEFTIILPK